MHKSIGFLRSLRSPRLFYWGLAIVIQSNRFCRWFMGDLAVLGGIVLTLAAAIITLGLPRIWIVMNGDPWGSWAAFTTLMIVLHVLMGVPCNWELHRQIGDLIVGFPFRLWKMITVVATIAIVIVGFVLAMIFGEKKIFGDDIGYE